MSRDLLATQGYFLLPIELPAVMHQCVLERDWVGLDGALRSETLPGGVIFQALREYAQFSEIEFIISIRSSLDSPDEDGIWHDDGSRLLAFSQDSRSESVVRRRSSRSQLRITGL